MAWGLLLPQSFAGGRQPTAAIRKHPVINTADTAWVLVSSALVLLMTPGLAFFYGGLVRKKNVLSVLMQCVMIMCLITVQWTLLGYSLAFGSSHGGLIGGLDFLALRGVGLDPNAEYAGTIPHQAFMAFQMMFAIITPALIVGAFAERIRFGAFCVFSLLWATLVYDPMAHWVWGAGGWLRNLGALDFAGGTVVHINAGMAALAAALVLGRRKGYPDTSPPHNLPFAVLGAGLLWFGWFGFNSGSALAANGVAVNAFLVTHVAAAAAGLSWALIEWLIIRRPTVLGIISGVVAGLVAITPAAGFVGIGGALAIGAGAGGICYLAVSLVKSRLGYDDSLDAFGVHGIGGIWGAIATGLWASTAVNPAGANGLFYGGIKLFGVQLLAVAVSAVYSFGASYLLFRLVGAIVPLRVSEHDERVGLDLTQHREAGYTLID
ncbi:MAG TPA: ammonium transporter [Planctomycetota bacterium]|nr:ammonium transporter [Planctomycetota bacterium]